LDSLREEDVTPPVVLTIGHSTRSIEEFIRLLKAHGVRRVIDVRTIPRSRHNPQFNRDTRRKTSRGSKPTPLEPNSVPAKSGRPVRSATRRRQSVRRDRRRQDLPIVS
jgi:hypothetical protein